MASRRPAPTHNPFDSDDEASSPRTGAYRNPFDHRGSAKNGPSQHHRSKPRQFDPTNPFDDEESDARNPFDSPPKKPASRTSSTDSQYHSVSSSPDLQEGGGDGGSARPRKPRQQFRERVSASGDAVLKKAQRIKDVGSNQASKLIGGVKESRYNAFKSSGNGNGDGNSTHGTQKSTEQMPPVRNELLGYDVDGEPKAWSKPKKRYEDSQFQTQDLEYKSTEDLQGYAVQKSEETTERLQSCLKVAENIREDATKTLLTLHAQGEQIRKTHEIALDIDQNLTTGEKLLGSLGGMFSRTWKPKKSRPVMGPAVTRNDSFKRRGNHLDQRVALGLNKGNSKGHNSHVSQSNALESTENKLQMERSKQDDALTDLSNILSDLKLMSSDMGHEIERQNEHLDGFQQDVDILNERVKGANVRGRRLLKK